MSHAGLVELGIRRPMLRARHLTDSNHPGQFWSEPWRPRDPLDRVQVRPVAVAGLDRVPLAGPILEPPSPFGDVGTVLGVSSPVLGMNQPEAALRLEVERVAVVGDLGHGARVGRGSDAHSPNLFDTPRDEGAKLGQYEGVHCENGNLLSVPVASMNPKSVLGGFSKAPTDVLDEL